MKNDSYKVNVIYKDGEMEEITMFLEPGILKRTEGDFGKNIPKLMTMEEVGITAKFSPCDCDHQDE